jgi:hypothetical protein
MPEDKLHYFGQWQISVGKKINLGKFVVVLVIFILACWRFT